MKPLFIPLRTVWFRAFEAGTNHHTCVIGRKAVLAHGYGHPRLERTIVGFKQLLFIQAPREAQEIFPDAAYIAAIQLR